ncbi:MAG: radical SAM protein [Calditrichota bacterium]
MLLSMQPGIIYGPVNSRRYGKSLGINLMPSRSKLCSFNCVYCQYGPTRRCTMAAEAFSDELPPLSHVIMAVEAALLSPLEFALITFSGNGEPTIYPDFEPLVREVKRLRDKYRPEVKIALLSNSSGSVWDNVQSVIPLIDLPIMKLDAGTTEIFQAVNRPTAGVDLDDITDTLERLPNIRLQTVLVDGNPSNSTPAAIAAWEARVAHIRPVEVHMYSIDRPVPNPHIKLVPPDRLQEIAAQVTRNTGVPVRTFGV